MLLEKIEKIVLLTKDTAFPWTRYLPAQIYGLSGFTIHIQRYLSLDQDDLQIPHLSLTFSLLILLLFLTLQYLFYFLSQSPSHRSQQLQPLILCSANKFNLSVQNLIEKTIGDYRPPWWYNRHLVSIIQFGQRFHLESIDEIFTHEDGSHFKVKWYPSKPSMDDEDFRICVFVPGLGSLSTDVSQRRFHPVI
jgi:hypothetical protein